MISAVAPPRDELTVDQVIGLLTRAEAVTVGGGVDVLDENDLMIAADIPIEGGQVSRDLTADKPLSGKFVVATELEWGWMRMRPWMTMSGEVRVGSSWEPVAARFNLGVLLPETPTRTLGRAVYGHDGRRESAVFDVDCYDKLNLLDVPLTDAVEIGTSDTDVMSFVETLIRSTGETKVRLSHDADGIFHPTGTFWLPTGDDTVLSVVNDLLELVAYGPLSTDPDGWFTAEPLLPVSDRSPEWTYSTSDRWTTVASAAIENDLFDLPNRWVFVNDLDRETAAIEGDGIHTRVNRSTGPGSVDGRKRTITRIQNVTVASQPLLVATALQEIEEMGRSAETAAVDVFPNPLHWGDPGRGDIVRVTSVDDGLDELFEVSGWDLPLNGQNMKLTARAVAPSFETVEEEWA